MAAREAAARAPFWGKTPHQRKAPSCPATRENLAAEAARLGFAEVAVAPVDVPLRRAYYERWIAEGRHGEMRWLEENNARRLNPRRILPEARSILCLGFSYFQPQPGRRGTIARYALGGDYHDLVYKRMKKLCAWLRQHGGDQKPYLDTGPVLERALAAVAGLGWQGKSTMLIHPRHGTWLFLGVILTTLEFQPDSAMPDHCGRCTRCITACPTGAITAPYELDARRCISYLTIENPGSIPVEFRRAVGDRLYGCDACLDACPWNRWAATTREAKLQARSYPDVRDLLGLDEAAFETLFTATPLKRLGRARLLRNACVVLGNIGGAEDLPALAKAAADPDALIAEHAAWAGSEIRQRTGRA